MRHFLEVLDELNHFRIISFRENIDTGGRLGRAVVILVGAIAELERNLIIERVGAGMRRAKLDGMEFGLLSIWTVLGSSAAVSTDRARARSRKRSKSDVLLYATC